MLFGSKLDEMHGKLNFVEQLKVVNPCKNKCFKYLIEAVGYEESRKWS